MTMDAARIPVHVFTGFLGSGKTTFLNALLQAEGFGRTAIIIAHRFSSIKHADRILVVAAGRIQHAGSYDDLIARSELFRALA